MAQSIDPSMSASANMDQDAQSSAGTLRETLERARAKKTGKRDTKRQKRMDMAPPDDAATAAAAGLEAMQHAAYGPADEDTEQPATGIGQVAEWNLQQRHLESQHAVYTAPPAVAAMTEGVVPPPAPMGSGSLAATAPLADGVHQEQGEKPKRGRGRPRRPLDPFFDIRQNVLNGQAGAAGGENQFRIPEAQMQRIIDFVGPSGGVPVKRKRPDGTSDRDAADGQGKLNVDEGEDEDVLPTAGPFMKSEVKEIEAAVEEYRAARQYTQFAVNDLIHQRTRDHRPDIRALWDGIYERFLLPSGKLRRTRVAIQRTTRRRFHNFESRGKWTAEEDQQLKACYEANPQKWVHIGKQLGRMPEDCRDRWRNYLACGDTRKQEDWTAREEQELTKAVEECKDEIRTELQRQAREERIAFREQDVESRVNFNAVSEKMHKTRSRLQCYQHWRIMQQRSNDAPYPTADDDNMTKMMKRMRKNRAELKFEKMTTRDKMVILQQVANGGETHEKDIPWKAITEADETSKWTAKDRKTAFRKMKAQAEHNGDLVPSMDLDTVVQVLSRQLQLEAPEEMAELSAAPPAGPGQSSSTPIRPRGRPKGKKNKAVAPAVVDAAIGEEEDTAMIDPRLEGAEAYIDGDKRNEVSVE